MKHPFYHRLLPSAVVGAVCTLLLTLGSCKTQTLNTTQNYTPSAKPVQMILDSDFGSSTDDLFALMMLNNYIDQGLVDLKGIVVDREGEKNAGVVDIFNTYYGHPDIPVALERNGVKNPRCFIPYNGICDMTDAKGQPLFKRSFDASQCPEGYKLYRKLLSQAEDKSLVVVAIGFATTLAQLFESGADEYSPLNGDELFGRKVKAVYIQSGRFEPADSLCGYNMRAASRQSAIFYDRLPKNVDLIMSPSNIGDAMDYSARDVMADLSGSDVNPIKSVYANYTCDTGQRMWDTNCLVNAVLGDSEYYLSPRGWVTFVDKGKESLMLFTPDENGNARYQMPGDSYFNQQKLMDIRRHNRLSSHATGLTIESPQPGLIGDDALAWTMPRKRQLVEKYMATAGNKLDPDDVRMLFRPIGYYDTNRDDYTAAEQVLEDTIYNVMLNRAVKAGKKSLLIVTGPPASGKSTATRMLNGNDVGLIYDGALNQPGRLDEVIDKAHKVGIDNVKVAVVYNDVLSCLKNSTSRGKNTWQFYGLDYIVNSFKDSKGMLANLHAKHPEVELATVDFSGNSADKGLNMVSIDKALQWNYDVNDNQMTELLNYVLEQVNSGDLDSRLLPLLTGNLKNLGTLSATNQALANQIEQRVQELVSAARIR